MGILQSLFLKIQIFQHKTKKIPPTFGQHTFPNIKGIKLTGSRSSDTFSREDITRKDASVACTQASSALWDVLGYLKHPHKADRYHTGYTGKWVPSGPAAQSQAGLPRAAQTALTGSLYLSKWIKSYSIAVSHFTWCQVENSQAASAPFLRSSRLRTEHETEVPAHQLLFCNLCLLPKQLSPVNTELGTNLLSSQTRTVCRHEREAVKGPGCSKDANKSSFPDENSNAVSRVSIPDFHQPENTLILKNKTKQNYSAVGLHSDWVRPLSVVLISTNLGLAEGTVAFNGTHVTLHMPTFLIPKHSRLLYHYQSSAIN